MQADYSKRQLAALDVSSLVGVAGIPATAFTQNPEMLEKRESKSRPTQGIVTVRTIGMASCSCLSCAPCSCPSAATGYRTSSEQFHPGDGRATARAAITPKKLKENS